MLIRLSLLLAELTPYQRGYLLGKELGQLLFYLLLSGLAFYLLRRWNKRKKGPDPNNGA